MIVVARLSCFLSLPLALALPDLALLLDWSDWTSTSSALQPTGHADEPAAAPSHPVVGPPLCKSLLGLSTALRRPVFFSILCSSRFVLSYSPNTLIFTLRSPRFQGISLHCRLEEATFFGRGLCSYSGGSGSFSRDPFLYRCSRCVFFPPLVKAKIWPATG